MKIKKGEHRLHFIWRVYKYQQDTKRLNTDGCGDICRRELGETYDESAYRKLYQYFDNMWEEVKDEYLNEEELTLRLIQIEQREEELYKQQVKTQDKLREMRSLLRTDARIDNLKDHMVKCAEIMSEAQPLILKKEKSDTGEAILLVHISDLHRGEAHRNFLSEYNTKIYDSNMQKILTGVLEEAEKEDCKTVKFLDHGDNINGNIHVSTRVASEEDAIEQTMRVAESFAVLLTETAKHIDNVEYVAVLDNHARINKNKKEHIEKESFGRLIPWYLESRLKDVTNIEVKKTIINDIEELTIGVVDVFDDEHFFVHGHLDNPATVIQNLTLMIRRFPVSVSFGHKHKNFENEIHGIELIGVPSGAGTSEYAVNGRMSSNARQKMSVYKRDEEGRAYRKGSSFIVL